MTLSTRSAWSSRRGRLRRQKTSSSRSSSSSSADARLEGGFPRSNPGVRVPRSEGKRLFCGLFAAVRVLRVRTAGAAQILVDVRLERIVRDRVELLERPGHSSRSGGVRFHTVAVEVVQPAGSEPVLAKCAGRHITCAAAVLVLSG